MTEQHGSIASVQQRLATIATADHVPAEAERTMVQRSVRDAVAVGLLGTAQRSVVVALAHARSTGHAGPAWIWGTSERVDAATAAFVNGTMVQALDYDDIAPAPAAHMSSVVVPAVAALVDRMDPDAAIDAIVAGLRAATVLSGLVSREAYARGLQPTHTIGAMAATCALGRALGLPASQISDAIGFACLQTVGLRANTGTPAKAMQSGLAAAAAVRAVLLAVDGGESGPAALDAFLSVIGVGADALAAAAHGDDPEPLDLALKLYPSCGAAHSAIETTLDVRAQLGSDGAPPDRVEVRVPPRMPSAMHFSWPSNADEARFSFAYCIDTAWRRGTLGVDDFDDEAMAKARERVRPPWLVVVPDTTLDPGGEQCRVTATVGGREASASVEYRDGYPERPLAPERAAAKARACLVRALGDDHGAEAFAALSGQHSIHDIGPSLTLETSKP
jgi:2-methylcitrate dehydratase PrpD